MMQMRFATITMMMVGLLATGCARRARRSRRAQPAPQMQPAAQGQPVPQSQPQPQAEPAGQRPPRNANAVKLGSRKVDFRGDHDTIMVTASEGRYRALRLHVTGSPMELRRMQVTFGNGQVFSPQVRHVFRQGAWTRRIDLPGKKRVIRKVEFWYSSVGRASGRARVQLLGIQ